jgi:hypothetical protein
MMKGKTKAIMDRGRELSLSEFLRWYLGVEVPMIVGMGLIVVYVGIQFKCQNLFQQLEGESYFIIKMALLGMFLMGVLFFTVGMVGYNNYESHREIQSRLDALLPKEAPPRGDGDG